MFSNNENGRIGWAKWYIVAHWAGFTLYMYSPCMTGYDIREIHQQTNVVGVSNGAWIRLKPAHSRIGGGASVTSRPDSISAPDVRPGWKGLCFKNMSQLVVIKIFRFSEFQVNPAADNYRLIAKGYSGNATDCLSHNNNRQFSTKDRDNDAWSNSCVNEHKGGWWFGMCTHSDLNGIYGSTGWDGIFWRDAARGYARRIMSFTEMKFRESFWRLLSLW